MDNLVVHHFLFQHNCFIETWKLKMCFPGILSELENWNKTNEQTNKQTSKHVKYYLALNFKFSLAFHLTYSFLYYLSMFFVCVCFCLFALYFSERRNRQQDHKGYYQRNKLLYKLGAKSSFSAISPPLNKILVWNFSKRQSDSSLIAAATP